MTQAELIAALPAGRLPATLMQLGAADLMVLFGAGLLLGAAVAALVAPLLSRTPSRRARLRATRGVPPQDRILAVARILGHLPDSLKPSAYVARPQIGDPEIERAALQARPKSR